MPITDTAQRAAKPQVWDDASGTWSTLESVRDVQLEVSSHPPAGTWGPQDGTWFGLHEPPRSSTYALEAELKVCYACLGRLGRETIPTSNIRHAWKEAS